MGRIGDFGSALGRSLEGSLSDQLDDATNDALSDGVIDSKEQEAIDRLQQSLNNIKDINQAAGFSSSFLPDNAEDFGLPNPNSGSHQPSSSRPQGFSSFTRSGYEFNALDSIAEDINNGSLPNPISDDLGTPGTNNGQGGAADLSGLGDFSISGDASNNDSVPNSFQIVIDLGDGIIEYTRAINNNVSFDHDGDGFRERSDWAGPNDAFLTLDLSPEGTSGADGLIDQARELAFAEWTVADTDDTDLEAFASLFDKNDDGSFNLLDFDENRQISVRGETYRWSDFRLWQDFDQDGEVDLASGELRTLDGFEILDDNNDEVADGIATQRLENVRSVTSIGLRHEDADGAVVAGYYNSVPEEKSNGNVLHGSASYTYEVVDSGNGGSVVVGEGLVGDLSLKYNSVGLRFVSTIDGFAVELEGIGYAHFLEIDDQDQQVDVNFHGSGLFGAIGDARANRFDASDVGYGVVLQGGDGNDNLIGGAAADLISGDDGADELFGGGGNDDLFFDHLDSVVDGGGGKDSASFIGAVPLTFNLSDHNVETLISGQGHDTLDAGDADWKFTIVGQAGFDSITGGDKGDLLSGGTGNDTIVGKGGKDAIFGGGGADSLSGSDGADLIDGGASADTLIGGAGQDSIYGGKGSDELFGDDGDDVLVGGKLSDSLFGGTGNDTLDGGKGTDTAHFTYTKSSSSFTLTNGALTVVNGSETDQVLNVEFLAFADTQISYDEAYGLVDRDTVYGNAWGDLIETGNGVDHIYAGSGNDSVNGGDGDDSIFGNDDQDVIYGGNGADTAYGGNGDDTLWGNNDNDVLQGGQGNDSVYGGNGDDTLDAGVSWATTNGNDWVDGGAGDDLITGSNEEDTLIGGDGNDIIRGGDEYGTSETDYFYGGTGNDSLVANQDDLDTTDVGDRLYGGDGDDTLIGGHTQDTLNGGADDDDLSGGAGNDVLSGGVGKDTLVGGAGADTASYDTSTSGVTVDLSAGVANDGLGSWDTLNQIEQIWASQYADLLTGDEHINVIWGNDGDDTIMGLDGNDMIYGGTGNDALFGDAGGDLLDGGDGTDLVGYSLSGYGLIIDLQNPNLNTGDAAGDVYVDIEGVWATAHNDNLRGDAGANTIWGRAGDDMIDGRDGNDTLWGNEGADTFRYSQVSNSSTAARDLIRDFDASEDLLHFGGLGYQFSDLTFSVADGNTTIDHVNSTFSVRLSGDDHFLSEDNFIF